MFKYICVYDQIGGAISVINIIKHGVINKIEDNLSVSKKNNSLLKFINENTVLMFDGDDEFIFCKDKYMGFVETHLDLNGRIHGSEAITLYDFDMNVIGHEWYFHGIFIRAFKHIQTLEVK